MKISNIKRFSLIFLAFITLSLEIFSQNANKHYSIVEGDTAYSIASKFGISLQELYDLNPWAKNPLKIGDRILLPDNAKIVDNKSASTSKIYIIKNGDTLYSIAKKFGLSEEQLMIANPGISAKKFPAGRDIVIPSADDINKIGDINQSITSNIANLSRRSPDAINVALALPFSRSQRYLEYYKGFLMGLNQVKQKGISVDVEVLDIPSNDVLREQILLNQFIDKDFVFAGVNDEQVQMLASNLNKAYLVLPFTSSENVLSNPNSRIVQINSSPSKINLDAANIFYEKYKDYNIYFVKRSQDEESDFAKNLKIKLTNNSLKYQTINLDEDNYPYIKNKSIVVAINKNKDLLEEVFQKLPSNPNYKLFGYPIWQSYPVSILEKLHKYNATIFSTFYFDVTDSKSIVFLNKFKDYYKTPVRNDFPKYAVMGYDTAIYFLETYHSNKSLEGKSKSLQMDFRIEEYKLGYVNSNIYFIDYAENSKVYKSIE